MAARSRYQLLRFSLSRVPTLLSCCVSLHAATMILSAWPSGFVLNLLRRSRPRRYRACNTRMHTESAAQTILAFLASRPSGPFAPQRILEPIEGIEPSLPWDFTSRSVAIIYIA